MTTGTSPALLRRVLRLLPLLVLGSVITAQAGLFSDDEARKAAADLRAEVLQRNSADDTRFARIEANIDNLQQATQKLKDSIDRLDQAIRNLGLPAMASQIDGVGQDVARLRGQIEVQGNQLVQEQKHSKEFYLDLDTRLKTLESGGKAADASAGSNDQAGTVDSGNAALNGLAPPVPTNGAKSAPPPAPAAANAAYERAMKAYQGGNYPVALKGLQTIAKTWPNTGLAPNVAFWTGMTQYRLHALTSAAKALKQVSDSYPDSPKAPDAMLNLASVQLEQGDTVNARQTLEDLLNRYPRSDAANKAKAKLGR